ncbi:hypothetical protein K402DRAFT_195158 [Aulographum hederae CBS 113979]|uniref:Auxin efflux carrier n=1 Tax=Aulographum hederae CBS 113979 TaxID=1176131 RepID=A0A6G1GNN8_9PEZI|nr:hypothetical protein K402DRAFT_195158 [Aulographum hederae CBS 113979]
MSCFNLHYPIIICLVFLAIFVPVFLTHKPSNAHLDSSSVGVVTDTPAVDTMGGVGASEIVTPLLGAIQASLSVLLTIFYGVLAAQLELLTPDAAKEVSRTCVRLFLPALLITQVGEQLHLGTWDRYWPILIWGILYNVLSISLGIVVTRMFKLPKWVTPALTFNNTTALPLLLLQSLAATGILDSLLISESDTASAALDRAKSYFLVNSMVSNSLTFAMGPRLLKPYEEDLPDDAKKSGSNSSKSPSSSSVDGEDSEDTLAEAHDDNYVHAQDIEHMPRNFKTMSHTSASDHPRHFTQRALVASPAEEVEEPDLRDGPDDPRTREEAEQDHATEESSLLPKPIVRASTRTSRRMSKSAEARFSRLPTWARETLSFLGAFLNPPLLGAAVGGLLGLVPALHKAFFGKPMKGGIFNAWLTNSVKEIGNIFAAMQTLVVGVKLSQSLRKMKKGEESGSVPWRCMGFIVAIRFLVWPAISIPIIYVLCAHTSILSDDPILWFSMMMMPTGPPAMILTSLADVNGSPESEKMSIAKFLTISYMITPLLCFTVVGSLKASEAAVAMK